MLIEPVAQMSRRSILGGRVPWTCCVCIARGDGVWSIGWGSGACIARSVWARVTWPRIRPTRIGRARIDLRIPICRTLLPVSLGTALGLPINTGLVLGPVRLRPAGLRPRSGSARPGLRRGTGRGRAAALAVSPGRGKTHKRDRGCQSHRAHSSRIEYPGHYSLPAPGRYLRTANCRSGCWKASPTGLAVGRCCPAFADREPRRPAPVVR